MKMDRIRCAALVGIAFGAIGGVSAAITQHTPAPPIDAPEPPQVTKPIVGIITPMPGSWNQLGIVNVATFPFDGTPTSALRKLALGPTTKTFFQSGLSAGPDLPLGNFMHLEYTPTTNVKTKAPGGHPHYHEFYEWGYTLKGDSVMFEPVSPFQKSSVMFHKKEGGWLDRPPYSLHSGGYETGGLRDQLPYELLIYEEGDGQVIGVGPKPGEPGNYRGRDGKGPPPGIVGDWRKVKKFNRPGLLDSVEALDWEEDPEVPGRFIKWLSDDYENGFRAQLVKIPPKWEAPAGFTKTYYESAQKLRYMIWGSMKVWQFSGPTDAGKAYKVGEEYFIYQPPRSIWGYGPGPVTNEGAVWLEVTYTKGLMHTPGAGPVEELKKL